MCSSLANDTGLSPSSGHNDCTDLNNLNDCLVGNMETEVDAYDVCDWKTFMKKFIPNVWTTLKGIICAICGIWTNIHNLWSRIENFMCYINYILDGTNVSALLDESDFVAGTGVDFNRTGEHIAKPTVRINGSTYTVTGSINVDLSTEHWGRLGLTNTGARVQWGSGASDYNRINTPNGNYTVCYIKIQKSKFPALKSLSSCVGTFVNAGVGQLYVNAYDGDTDDNQMTGQWGYDSTSITVPAGYIYLRVSLISLTTWGIEYGGDDNNAAVTFRATGLARTDVDGIPC